MVEKKMGAIYFGEQHYLDRHRLMSVNMIIVIAQTMIELSYRTCRGYTNFPTSPLAPLN